MSDTVEALIKQLTLEEKVSLLSGADSWHTRKITRLGIPAIRVADGPHGVRRSYEDDSISWPATSFPTVSAMAATWNADPDVAGRRGAGAGNPLEGHGNLNA